MGWEERPEAAGARNFGDTRAFEYDIITLHYALWAVPDVLKRFSLLSREGLWSHFWASTYPLYLIKGMGRQQPQSN